MIKDKNSLVQKGSLLISMSSIDLTVADEAIRATRANGRPARDPSKVRLIRTWKCCVKNRLLLVIMGSYRWLQVVGGQSIGAPSHFLKAVPRRVRCSTGTPSFFMTQRHLLHGAPSSRKAATLIPAVRPPISPLYDDDDDNDDGVRFRGVTDLSRGNPSCRMQYAGREPQTSSILSFSFGAVSPPNCKCRSRCIDESNRARGCECTEQMERTLHRAWKSRNWGSDSCWIEKNYYYNKIIRKII